ncbi:NTP transferase domain-containing protein, partial [bacterium]|nr:NTP transferase domain-containing protein [bacterium]
MSLSIIIMAAGRGSRMKSELPKVLHHAMGKPMLQYAIDAVKPLKPSKLVVVIGNGAELVKDQVQDKSITFVEQKELLGTGDAVATAMRHIKKGTVLVMNGDCPLITSKSLKQFLARHKRSKNDLSLLSFIDPEMSGYGRIFRDDAGNVTEIVEDKHATAEERKIFTELNGGIYLISSDVLSYLDKVKLNRASGEYYLTDLVEIAAKRKRKLNAYTCPAEEVRGVNSRRELYEVSDILRKKTIAALMDRGVTFIDPNSCIIHGGL